jgi:hypothetical protein
MMKKLIITVLFVITCGIVHAKDPSINFAASFLTGPISGFVQIPAGGQAGTTSYHQPTFKDLGIKRNNNYDLFLGLNWRRLTFYGGYQNIRLSGATTLNKTIITHNVTIPTGSYIKPKVTLDWMRLGAQYNFLLNDKWTIAPQLEAVVMDFDYRIPNYITPRSFKPAAARIGIYSNYDFNQKIALDGDVASAIPVFHLNIINANVRLKYTLFTKQKITTKIFAGAGYLYIRFKDQQPTPNYILYRQPLLQAGFIIKYL